MLLTIFTAAFLSIAAFQLSADRQTEDKPRLEARPGAFSYSETFDPAQWQSLFSLAYWVSGAEEDWQSALPSIVSAVDDLAAEISSMGERAKAERVLEFMHQRYLTSYSVHQTRFDTLLNSGKYNCVSSAILYAVLSTAVGLDVTGVGTIDHAFCSVRVGEQQIDVETTNSYGFDPGSKTDFQDAFGKTTGYIYVPPRNYRDRRKMDLINLFSLVLSNRISDAESAGDYLEAVGLAVDRWTLLGGGRGDAFEELIDRMVNYGVTLAESRQEEAAVVWADEAISAYGPHPKWDNFLGSVVNNLIVKFLREGKIAEARFSLNKLKPRLPAGLTANLDLSVSDAELLSALNDVENGGDESGFFAALESARTAGIIPLERILEVEENWLLNKINLIARTEGWEAAYKAAAQAIIEIGPSSKLEDARRIIRKNHIAELYNEAVSAYNARRYSEALRLTKDAIAAFPDEKLFSSLLMNIEKTIGSGQ